MRDGRRLHLPVHWTTVKGLWLRSSGLAGTVLTDCETVLCFEGAKVIEVDVGGWSMVQVIECLVNLRTPEFTRLELRNLARADLEPLLAIDSLHQLDALRLLSHVPGWQP